MDDAGVVGEGGGQRDLVHHLDRAPQGEAVARPGAGLGRAGDEPADQRTERLAPGLAHREEQPAVGQPAQLVDGDDVRVLQAGGQPRLAQELLDLERHRGERGLEDLEQDGALEDAVVDAADLPHAALGEQAAIVEAIGGDGGDGARGVGAEEDGRDGGGAHLPEHSRARRGCGRRRANRLQRADGTAHPPRHRCVPRRHPGDPR
ncbi:MAG: hypothetical protein R3F59_31560 [Myxococcota bacterium]